MASVGERIQEGNAALARGAWGEARAIFEQELEARETVDALEGLSWAAWWAEDVATCIDARERAFRLSRREGDMRRAAILALWVADDYLILRGERAIANGWFQRAARILESEDGRCGSCTQPARCCGQAAVSACEARTRDASYRPGCIPSAQRRARASSRRSRRRQSRDAL